MRIKNTVAILGLGLSLFGGAARGADTFVREDWAYVVEPTGMDRWGINHWGVVDFMLPYRVVQRAKHQWESSHKNNWLPADGSGGKLKRGISTFVDMGLHIGLQNMDHVMGHDSRARELSKDYPGSYTYISRRYTQILPVFFGGSELNSEGEKVTSGLIGADAKALDNSTLWEAHNQFAYFTARDILAQDTANATQLENFIFYRFSMAQLDWLSVKQVCVDNYWRGSGSGSHYIPPQCRAGEGSAPDWSNYLMDVNTGRYGVTAVGDYKLTINDLKLANAANLLDPLFILSVYRYSADYIGHGKNRSRIPMLNIPGTGVDYLPGLRVDLSPFGIEYIQDNYFRYKGTLTNLFWTTGDNNYEKRLGAGFDVSGLPLGRAITAGLFGQLSRQPLMSRIMDTSALTPAELGARHDVYNYGASLRIPLSTYGDPADPKQFFLTLMAGKKNTGWIPGEYIKGSTYMNAGLGLHL